MAQGLRLIRAGELQVAWDTAHNIHIERKDATQHIVMSQTEWEWLVRLNEIHDTPLAPPVPGDVPPF